MAVANSERNAQIKGKNDWGIKISKNEHGVDETEQFQIMHSSYPVLKLCKSGQGQIVKAAEGGGVTVTIPHNLGYIPICFVYGTYFDTPGEQVVERYSLWNKWIYQGLQVADLYSFYADETNLYINLSLSYLTDAYAFTLDYMYHIFFDEAEVNT